MNPTTMQIVLSSPTHLKITWPLYSSEIDQQIRERLNTVPGIEAGHGRVAWAPVIQFARLVDLFPKAEFDYRCFQESDRVARAFWSSMMTMHVELAIDASGAVFAVSEVSDDVQQLIRDRSPALKPFVEEAMNNPVPILARRATEPVAEVQYPRRRKAKKQRRTA